MLLLSTDRSKQTYPLLISGLLRRRNNLLADARSEFAKNIKLLNTGQQSVEQTLANVREIFGTSRPFLFQQLQRLVKQASTV